MGEPGIEAGRNLARIADELTTLRAERDAAVRRAEAAEAARDRIALQLGARNTEVGLIWIDRVAELEAALRRLLGAIPGGWPVAEGEFALLVSAIAAARDALAGAGPTGDPR